MAVRVICNEHLNTSEMVRSGRLLALVEVQQPVGPEPFDPIARIAIASDDSSLLRAIFLYTESEMNAQAVLEENIRRDAAAKLAKRRQESSEKAQVGEESHEGLKPP